MRKSHTPAINEAIQAMFSHPSYSNTYMFYGHILAQCNIIIDKKLPAAAGIAFINDHYNLYINPDIYDTYSLLWRVGIIKHEMLHILNNHVMRKENRIHQIFNEATDCAINQLIDRTHLPEYVIYPDTYPFPLELKESAEYYYDKLIEQYNNDENNESGGGGSGEMVGTHDTWEQSEGIENIKEDITKGMIENAISNTNKQRGNLPENIESLLNLFKKPSQVSWRQVLRRIVGNKKVNSRRTIMRQDRRFPNREELKGKTKDRTFDLTVIVDVSGSMSNEEIMTGMNEIKEICDLSKVTINLIQVDTEIHKVEKFDKNTKIFTRSGCGGTHMEPAINYIRENRIPTDACILITDGEIENIGEWQNPPRYRMIFLTTSSNIPGIEGYRHFQQFNLISER